MLQRLREARENENGFTLIELLIVIVVLGVLSGIVVFAVSGIQDKGEASACKSNVKTVTVAAEAYYADNGAYAADIAALKTAGLLHSTPTDVTYSTAGGVLSVTGAAGSNCAGFSG